MINNFVTLVGCPEKDVPPVRATLAGSNVNLRADGSIADGDYAVFCISCCDGPTEGTRKSVLALQAREMIPLAIVLTYAEFVPDDSLRSLVTCEERALLSAILPEAIVDELPILHDFDPNLAAKIEALMRTNTAASNCKGANRLIIQIVKFESALSEEEVLSVANDRVDQFRSLLGLIQKYYVKLDQPNHYGGVYLWDSLESLRAYRESDLAASIPSAYKVVGKPTFEILETVFQLRE